MILSPLHCETQATWENPFFTVLIIKLRMFGGYIFVIETSTGAKTQASVFALYDVYHTLIESRG